MKDRRTLEASLSELVDSSLLEEVNTLEHERLHGPVRKALDNPATRQAGYFRSVLLSMAAGRGLSRQEDDGPDGEDGRARVVEGRGQGVRRRGGRTRVEGREEC